MITKEKMPWSFIKFSQLILKGNVWRSVWRICILILGLKGLTDSSVYVPTRKAIRNSMSTYPICITPKSPLYVWTVVLSNLTTLPNIQHTFLYISLSSPHHHDVKMFISTSLYGVDAVVMHRHKPWSRIPSGDHKTGKLHWRCGEVTEAFGVAFISPDPLLDVNVYCGGVTLAVYSGGGCWKVLMAGWGRWDVVLRVKCPKGTLENAVKRCCCLRW